MTARLGGMDFDIMIGTTQVHVESITLDITDNTAVAQTRGVPNGYVNGDVSAEGEMELDEQNFKKLNAAARAAGSWRDLGVFDILFYGQVVGETSKIEAFGCKLTISSLFGADPKGGEKSTKTVPYKVTAPEFISIDGVSYLSSSDLRGIVG
ncbi:phage protein [Lelliottia nimipressuralis]|uniref:phage protein n=1 Tax=Lelliottia nimipressuralis TaxID=69220 RepID=UPI002896BB7C|nr:phage protein [Lelliottia nimipressuralis]